jgi:uncharacterized protein (DUF433 family)
MNQLLGIGLYSPVEAARLLHIPAPKIARWLRGHDANGKRYEALWLPQVILDDRIYLGFRDLMEVRVADAFIRNGVPAVRVRAAIELAKEAIADSHPLSTNRFLTAGREVFLHVIETDEEGNERERLLNLFRRQYEFKGIIDPVLKAVDFGEDGYPFRWWPAGRRANIVVDPDRSFGAPIEVESSIPTAVLAAHAAGQGVPQTAKAFQVTEASVRRAVEYEATLERKLAA